MCARSAAPPASRLDALTFVVSHFLPHLNRDAVYRILKPEGLNRLPLLRAGPQAARHLQGLPDRLRPHRREAPAQAAGSRSRAAQTRPVHRYRPRLPLRASRGRGSRSTTLASALLADALGAFPFRVTHLLTDRFSCFTADALEAACERYGMQHRRTRPYTSKTNGVAERFDGRV